ncbi:hypothetical protein BDZ89DRAFT_1066127 [Hymenopellis radicata]|nr:hypothetical protein BDZ89DRAFT_1066127 [Hymenopellis radicata]
MSDAELLVIPNIPGDIVRSILETLAIMSRPDALKLVLVSKTVRKWIDIVLYNAVTVLSIPKFFAFVNAIQSRTRAGEASFFAISVKYLLLVIPKQVYTGGADIFAEKFTEIMSACSGLVSLGLRYYDPKFVASLVNHPFPRLQRFSLFQYGANTPLEHLPPSLTHLKYLRGTLPPALLQTVPLTHLHVILDDASTGLVAMKQVLEAMPNTVQLCIFSFRNVRVEPEPEGLNAIRDPRVILLDIAANTSYYMGRAEEDLPKHGSGWKMLHRDCGFLPDGDLDSWEFCANLVKERAKRMQSVKLSCPS